MLLGNLIFLACVQILIGRNSLQHVFSRPRRRVFVELDVCVEKLILVHWFAVVGSVEHNHLVEVRQIDLFVPEVLLSVFTQEFLVTERAVRLLVAVRVVVLGGLQLIGLFAFLVVAVA